MVSACSDNKATADPTRPETLQKGQAAVRVKVLGTRSASVMRADRAAKNLRALMLPDGSTLTVTAAHIGVSRDRVVGIDPPGHAAADVVVEEVELVVPEIGERLQVVAEIDRGIAIGSVEAARTCGRGEASVRDPLGPEGRTIENR